MRHHALHLSLGLLVLFFSCAAWSTDSDLKEAVDRAYFLTMKRYLQDIEISARRYPDLHEFASQTFQVGQPKEMEYLKGARTPKVRFKDDGRNSALTFEFDDKTSTQIRLGAFGDVTIEDRPAQHALRVHKGTIVSAFLYASEASAGLALAGRLAIGAFRLIAGNSVRVTAGGAGAGAVVGCYAGASMKYDYESYAQGCGNGALDGALILSGVASIPYFNDRGEALLSKTAKLNPRVVSVLKGFGVVGSIAAVMQSAPALATMNGSILRCSGSNGDFILSARTQGATRYTLYESFDGLVEFHGEKGGLGRIESKQEAFVSFLKQREHFKKLTDEQVVQVAQKMVADLEANRQTCRRLGDGQTVNQTFDIERRTFEDIRKTGAGSTVK